jgi:hypothetical protein
MGEILIIESNKTVIFSDGPGDQSGFLEIILFGIF